ncbi:hypothetical protein HYFRA_00011365 [Hymenoscyphus fraxineus]|uniref:Uncharacterized protein n=1 Tax=Hymenoscyphus fraxineus TaxID=746836 RepID=A0A9N9KYH5_9HELO|nr:hypothetical protein HYFRA_00011365 [Hymenoscyphus fraxineus]
MADDPDDANPPISGIGPGVDWMGIGEDDEIPLGPDGFLPPQMDSPPKEPWDPTHPDGANPPIPAYDPGIGWIGDDDEIPLGPDDFLPPQTYGDDEVPLGPDDFLPPETYSDEDMPDFDDDMPFYAIYSADTYLDSRQNKLRDLQQGDLLAEKRFLETAFKFDSRPEREGQWLRPDMDYGMVLQLLSEICEKQSMNPKDPWVIANGTVKGEEGDFDGRFKKYPSDRGTWTRDPTSEAALGKPIVLNFFKSLKKWEANGNELSYNSRTVLARRLRLIDFLTLSRRFADPGNPELARPIRATEEGLDDIGIKDKDLKIAWVLYRVWIRLLHYRSLSLGENEFGKAHLTWMINIAINRYYREVTKQTPWYAPRNDPEIQIWPKLVHARKTLERFVEAFHTRLDAYNREKTSNYGLNDDEDEPSSELLEALIQGAISDVCHHSLESWKDTEAFIDDDHERRLELWTDLHLVADEVRQRMGKTHVEGVLLERKIVLKDEWWQMYKLLENDTEPYGPTGGNWWSHFDWQSINDNGNFVKGLERMEDLNLLRRNNLLLRDWSGRKPIKQLYYVFDTRDDGQHRDYREAIDDFYWQITYLAGLEQWGISEDSPSRRENVFKGLFPIHPVGLHAPSKVLPLLWNNDNDTPRCLICWMDIGVGDLLAQLPCQAGHTLHHKCILEEWGNEFYDANQPCPVKDGSPYNMHKEAGITQEFTPGTNENATYNLFDGFTTEEDKVKARESNEWAIRRNFREERLAEYEMAHVRNWRRKKERDRKWEVNANRAGYYAMEYPSGPDKLKVNYSVRRKRKGLDVSIFDFKEPDDNIPFPGLFPEPGEPRPPTPRDEDEGDGDVIMGGVEEEGSGDDVDE